MTFTELGILPALTEALAKENITQPMPIQSAAIPLLLAGKNAYLNSETGTGKTLAYLLPLLGGINPAVPELQAMILAPTHELAIQIQRVALALTQNSGLPIRTILLIGGTAIPRQLEKLKKKPHLAIGSPGRIRDLIIMKKLKPLTVKSVVIDEADRLLTDETLVSVRNILYSTPRTRQVIFASATEHDKTSATAKVLAPDLEMIRAGAAPVNANIEHLYLVCEERDKPELLRKLIHALNPERAIVFVHRNEKAEVIAGKLAFHKLAASDLHGAYDKSERKKAMDDFRSAKTRILIASDIAARGLDIAGVTHIFNVDVPSESKAYLHRVGRTARAGAKGHAISLMTEDELRLVTRYQSELGITLDRVILREGEVLVVE
ncbi:MAG: DEAD/DEAH box helicase [bacterium]